MMRRINKVAVLVAALSLSVGCSEKGKDKPSEPAQKPTDVSKPPPPEPKDEVERPLDQHMQGHFVAIRDIERALVGGDLAKAKERAHYLAQHKPHDAVDAWEPHLDTMKEAAAMLSKAPNVEIAVPLAAKLGSECARCHTATTAITSFPHEMLPVGRDDKAQMQRHQWAMDRLWEGLIGPSAMAWAQGAEVLASAPFMPTVRLSATDKATAQTLADKVHKLGERASKDVDSAAEREAIYGELLLTCARCHAVARPKAPTPK